MNKKLKRKQALIMAEPYRTPFNSKVAKVSGDVIEDSVGGIKYATSFNGATKIEDANVNKIKIKDGIYYMGKSVNLLNIPDKEETTTNGVTYSIKDGVITLNGTPTTGSFILTLFSVEVDDTSFVGTYLVKNFGTLKNSYLNVWYGNYEAKPFQWTATQTRRIQVEIPNGETVNGTLIPMLVSGSTIPTKYYSGSYGIKIEVADGVMTCNGILASDSEQNWWYNFELPISSGIYSANMFLRSSNINVYLSHDLYDWANSYQIAVKEASTAPLSNINVKTDCTYMFFDFDREHDYDNLVLKPMLVLGQTAPTSFEPNFKNLLEIKDLSERTKDGLTYYYKNGMIIVNGTSKGAYTHIYDNSLGAEDLEDGATYSFNDISNNNNLYLQFSLAKKDGTTQYLTKKNSFVWDSNIYSICYIAVQTAPTITTFNNLVIKPIFVKSSIIPTQFIPFANPYFVSLGQSGSVQYNGLEPREIDLKGNVLSKINNQASDKLSNYALTKNTKVVDLGSLDWWDAVSTSQANIVRYRSVNLRNEAVFPSSNDTIGNILCTRYNVVSGNSSYQNTKGVCLDNATNLIIYDPDYNTSDKLEEFKKSLRGVLLIYQVKNPTTINTTSFKTFKEDTNATISDDNFTSSINAITETFKPTRSYDFKVNGFSNLIKSSNLFFLPNIESTTLLGLTYSVSNQKMTIKGTASQQYIIVYSFDITDKMSVGKTYVLQCSSGSADLMLQADIKKSDDTELRFSSYDNKKFTWTSDNTKIVLIIQTTVASGITINLSNITFGLYETDNVSIPYEPYFDPYIESFADKKNLFDNTNSELINLTFNAPNQNLFPYINFSSKCIYLKKGLYYLKNFNNLGMICYNSYDWNGTSGSVGSIGFNDISGSIDLDQDGYIFITNRNANEYNAIFESLVIIQGKTAPTTFLPYQDKYSAFLNVKGKNLFDNANTPLVSLTFNGSNQDLYGFLGYFTKAIYLKKGKYTFKSDKYTIIGKATKWTGEFGSSSVGEAVKAFSATIELEKDMYVLITNNYQYEYDAIFESLIIIEGDTAPTEYEPYYSFTKEVLIKQPLRKFDYLTYEGVYRQTNEITLDGSWNVVANNYLFASGWFAINTADNCFPDRNDWGEQFSKLYVTTTSDLPLISSYEMRNGGHKKGIAVNNKVMMIKLDDSADNSLNNWTVEKVNNYFKQNPITITYKTVDQTFEATSLTRLLFKNGYNKITPYDSINNNAIVEYLEYYKSKGD